MHCNSLLLTLSATLGLSACSWVELNEGGEKVRLLSEQEVVKCLFKGNTSVSVTDKLVGVRRHDEAIQQELIVLARNSAANMQGDTIVPLGDEADGRRRFAVYRCVPRPDDN